METEIVRCAHCGVLLGEKRRDEQINGKTLSFCPEKYSFIAGSCASKFRDNHGIVVKQFRVISA